VSQKSQRRPARDGVAVSRTIATLASASDFAAQDLSALACRLERERERLTDLVAILVTSSGALRRADQLEPSNALLDAQVIVLDHLAEARGDHVALELIERSAGLEGDR